MTLLQRSLVLVMICLAPVVLAQVVNTLALREARQQEIVTGVWQQASSYASDLNQLFDSVRAVLDTVLLMPAVRDQEEEGCRTLLTKVREKNKGTLENIGLADVNGRTVCSVETAPAMLDLTKLPFSGALEKKELAIGDLGVMAGGRPPAVAIAVPVSEGGDSATTGLIWATVTPEAITKILRKRTPSPNAALVVSDRNGRIIASAPDESVLGQTLPPDMTALVNSNVIGTQQALGPDGVVRLFGYIPVTLRPSGQFVAVGIDQKASLQQIDSTTWRAAALIGVGIVLGLIFAVLGSRRFLQQPIDHLTEAARRWREGDFTARANLPPGTSEFATLATAFDEMADALASRTAEQAQAKQRAEQRASEAEAAEQQKSLLLQEVNHRVKNSLQLVSSLLNLQGGSVREEGIRHHFAAAAARVQTIARVHARLFQTGHVRNVEFGQYLKDLCADLGSTYAQQNQPRFDIDVVRVSLPTDRVIPLALIVNELLTNVFKYAYPAGQPVRVRVETRLDGEGTLVVVVADEGIGLPADFDLARSGGLGMRLIASLVAQLDAHLEVKRPAHGTRFTLRVPLASAGTEEEEG
jgi:two-component sensor histidine kinase